MKVILDIITNHTADVIRYRECDDPDYRGRDRVEGGCAYRSEAEYPYTTRGGPSGRPINRGFAGIGVRTQANFEKLSRTDWAYTPYLPVGDEEAKTPAWLNDPRYYHNRGNFDYPGESFLNGDFSGLDDLMTEHPRVIEGMIEIFGQWIEDFELDGFRIDTARHVNPEFWQVFVPAMHARAAAIGKDDFYIFGEVYDFDPEALARHTRVDGFPAVLDFALQGAARMVMSTGGRQAREGAMFDLQTGVYGTYQLARIFEADVLYEGGFEAASRLPTFLDNHDMGRFSMFLRQANPDAAEEEILARLRLAHVLLMTARGVPTLYAGGEQGFVSDGNDQAAREDMFESKVASYNDNDLLGTDRTTAEDNFDTEHPMFRFIAKLAAIRKGEPALRRGEQKTRYAEEAGGLFAFSRIHQGEEVLVVLNVSDETRTKAIEVEPASRRWVGLLGSCGARSEAQASYRVRVPALGAVVCKSQGG
jgi:glycosidase